MSLSAHLPVLPIVIPLFAGALAAALGGSPELIARSVRDHLADVRAEAERWRAEAKEALDGLGVAIDAQFERWSLSSAEREVGLLLLKGLSHQEIADVRGVSERTARQQARAVYKKAGLSGRAELSAYFLEDLLLPQDQARRG